MPGFCPEVRPVGPVPRRCGSWCSERWASSARGSTRGSTGERGVLEAAISGLQRRRRADRKRRARGRRQRARCARDRTPTATASRCAARSSSIGSSRGGPTRTARSRCIPRASSSSAGRRRWPSISARSASASSSSTARRRRVYGCDERRAALLPRRVLVSARSRGAARRRSALPRGAPARARGRHEHGPPVGRVHLRGRRVLSAVRRARRARLAGLHVRQHGLPGR